MENNFVETSQGRLILDGHKLPWHYDRVQQWESGEHIAPISIDMALSRACQASCRGCIDQDELISMSDGTFKRMIDILPGDVILSVDDDNSISSSVVKDKWLTNSYAKVLSCYMKNGMVLRCTPNHLILTKNGWVESSSLVEGDKVATFTGRASENIRKDEREQPYEKFRVCTKDGRDSKKSWYQPNDVRTNSTESFVRGISEKESSVSGRERCRIQENEREQSYEESRCCYQSPRDSKKDWCQREDFSEKSRDVEVWGDDFGPYSNDKRCGYKQNRAEVAGLYSTSGVSIYGRRSLLGHEDFERNISKSGFCLDGWSKENCVTSSRKILAHSVRPELQDRVGGLCGEGLECVCFMGGKSFEHQKDYSFEEGNNWLVEWSEVERIKEAGYSRVYDLECSPNHNFIASGVVVHNCYAMLQESDDRSNITVDDSYRFLDDAAKMGVRGISLISDGESTLSKAYVPFIERASELGIDVGNATNGWIFNEDILLKVLPKLSWVRFTVLAGNPRSFTNMMHHDSNNRHVFWNAMYNISTAVKIKRRLKLPVTLGIQTFIMPQDKDEILDFARLALDLGVDYGVIKHTSDDEKGSLGVNYDKYNEVFEILKNAESMSTEDTKIIVKWSKIKDGNQFSYDKVYGPQFLLQISGSGLVAPTGMFFNSRYAKMHIGNFVEQSFYDMWKSDRYWQVMDYLSNAQFNAKRMMGTLPIQHYANVALDNHIKGVERIQPITDWSPLHVNFV